MAGLHDREMSLVVRRWPHRLGSDAGPPKRSTQALQRVPGDLPKNAKTSEKKDAEMAVQMYVDEAITGKGRDRCVLVLFFNRVMPVVVIG